MDMNQVRNEMMAFVSKCGGKKNCGYTWGELLTMFKLPVTKENEKMVSDWWRYFQDTQSLSPNHTGIQVDVPDGFEVKSIWGKEGNYSVSLRKINEGVNSTEEHEKFLDAIAEAAPVVEFPNYPKRGKYAYEISIPDFHIGRTDVFKARELYVSTFMALLDDVRNDPPEEIVIPIGNDFFNADGVGYTTTKGTPQFDVDNWRVTFRSGWEMLTFCIDKAAEVAPVKVIRVEGNHDEERAFYLGEVIAAWFRNDARVDVNTSMDEFLFYEYGVNMIMYEHGELKASDYPLIMATEQPEMFARTKYREVHTAHFHKEMVVDSHRGIIVRFLPSITTRSQWERKKGYLSLRTSQGLKFDKKRGLCGITPIINWDED